MTLRASCTFLFAVLITTYAGGSAQPLFDHAWYLRPNVSFDQLARFIVSANLAASPVAVGMGELHAILLSQYEQDTLELRNAIARGKDVQDRYFEEPWQVRDPSYSPAETDFGQSSRVVAWQRRRAGLEAQFERDVLQLLEKQEHCNAWIDMNRELRRVRVLSYLSATSGDRRIPDLTVLLEPSRERQELSITMDAYEEEMDAALGAIEFEYPVLRAWFDEHREMLDMDNASARARQMRMVQLLKEPRLVNDRFVEALASQMAEAEALEFRSRVDKATFPHIFVPSPADIALRGLMSARGITMEQVAAIARISADYNARLRDFNMQITATIRAIDAMSEESLRKMVEEARARDGRAHPPDSHKEIGPWRERYNLVKSTCRELRALFSDEELRSMRGDVRVALAWSKPRD